VQDLSFSLLDIWAALLRDLQAIWRQSSSTVLVALAIASIVLIVSAIVCRILPQQRQHIALGAASSSHGHSGFARLKPTANLSTTCHANAAVYRYASQLVLPM
jgi:hypothetical protein